MNPDTHTLTVKVHKSAYERLREEAALNRVNLSEWVRMKLGITTRELIEEPDDRFEGLERRLSRLEEMAGL